MIPVPDGLFYYTLSTLLAMGLIWVIGRFVNRMEARNEKIDAILKHLEKKSDVHDIKIESLEEDFADIKGVPFIRYPREK